ncbi:MAG: DpnD/PcfM family protein [Lachnospiraceae bacterium]|nr:DpnD/PcfM family protein [Lachnospiraceae bacterium]
MAEYKEKKIYRVAIVEVLRRVVTVEAEDEFEAHQRVSDGWYNSEYILDSEDFDGAEFHVLGEKADDSFEGLKPKGGEVDG